MNKAYFLVPLIAMLAFGGYWWNFRKEYNAKKEAQQIAEVHAREEKAAKDKAAREQAVKDAIAANDKRKAEKAAKEAKEKKDKEEREASIEFRNKSRAEQFKLSSQSERIDKEVRTIKEEIAKIDEGIKRYGAEKDFLKDYVKKAESNVKSLQAVAEKIEKADNQIKDAFRRANQPKAPQS